MQGLRNSGKLPKGEFDLQADNSARVADIAIWTYFFNLPSDLCLKFGLLLLCPYIDEEHFSGSYLKQKGFHLYFVTIVVTL